MTDTWNGIGILLGGALAIAWVIWRERRKQLSKSDRAPVSREPSRPKARPRY